MHNRSKRKGSNKTGSLPPWFELLSFSFLTRNYNVVWGSFGLINKVFVVVGFVLFSFSVLTRFYKGVSARRCLLRLLAGGDGDRGGTGGRATADSNSS